MARCLPENPRFATGSEELVWRHLAEQLTDDALLVAGQRVTDHAKDHELDLLVVVPGAGVVAVEVKGGEVWCANGSWWQRRSGRSQRIDPVGQVRAAKYALRQYVEADPRWRAAGRSRLRWAHVVVLPYADLPDGFAMPDCPRWSVVDRSQLGDLATALCDVPQQQETHNRAADDDDVALIVDVLAGYALPQRDVVAAAVEREHVADRLTTEQQVILDATRLLHRVEVRGGAGSGKTFLALARARRLAVTGQRVALVCYSHGLAGFLRRVTAGWPRRHRPAYVGEFHGLGLGWGAAAGPPETDRSRGASTFWEHDLPRQMADLARALPSGHRFDAVVVDEAQDFADDWWLPLTAALRDEDAGGLYVFSDEGQRVFDRQGTPPVPLVPLLLDHNLRNTRQIAGTFAPLASSRMRLLGGDGPDVRLVPCPAGEAVHVADDQVDLLLDAGWRPQDVALLTTGSRHAEQVARQSRGNGPYWDSFWDDDQVFYGHVLGFKGLERRVVVLAANETEPHDRSRERLYVGLSRARDELVVCGDPAFLQEVGGDAVSRRLRVVEPR